MRNSRNSRTASAFALAAAVALTLAACGGGGDEPTSGGSDSGSGSGSGSGDGAATGDVVTLTVGASPVPHAEILQFVDDGLAADAGIDLEIVEFTDYVLPNVALSEGEIDANYFQHVPYFDAEVSEKNYEFERSEGIHIEPFGVYSEKVGSLDELADGAAISVTNDPSNQARALQLLEAEGLITLADGVEDPTIYDIAENSKNLQFTELNPEQLTTTLQDVDASVINGNFALDAGLVPTEDAIALESGEDNPYANIVAYRSEDADSKAIQALVELLTSEDVKTFIEETWPNGELIPAF